MQIWKIGAALSAMTCSIALIAQALLPSDANDGLARGSEYWTYGDYGASWQDPSPECELSSSCVYLVIDESKSCSADVVVDFTITDEEDKFLASQTMIILRGEFESGKAYEIGTDTPDVGYFEIDEIRCSIGTDTTEHEI